jgi:hypothetical protein
MDWHFLAYFARKNIVPDGYFFHPSDEDLSPGIPAEEKAT